MKYNVTWWKCCVVALFCVWGGDAPETAHVPRYSICVVFCNIMGTVSVRDVPGYKDLTSWPQFC